MRRIGLAVVLALNATLIGVIVLTSYIPGAARTAEEEQCAQSGGVWRGMICEQPDIKRSHPSPSGASPSMPTKWDERKKIAETAKDWGQMAA